MIFVSPSAPDGKNYFENLVEIKTCHSTVWIVTTY